MSSRLLGLTLLSMSCCSLLAGQSFEVVTIRPSPPYPSQGGVNTSLQGGPDTEDPAHIHWNFVTLTNLISAGFSVRADQIRGPGFLGSQAFDIAAVVPEGATKEQVRAMWRNLLAERFGMMARIEKQEVNGHELVAAKEGSRLRESKLPEAGQSEKPIIENGQLKGPGLAVSYRVSGGVQTAKVMASAQPISALVNFLSNELKEPVVDRTDLHGKYDFEFAYTPRSQRVGANTTLIDSIDVLDALASELGLHVRDAKMVSDYIIVEGINRSPTEN